MIFVLLYHFACDVLHLVIREILFCRFGACSSDCQVLQVLFFNFLRSSVKMATKKQPVMEWTDDHDILLLREMIASELFQFKKGSADRGKIWESIQERLNKLDNPKFMITLELVFQIG